MLTSDVVGAIAAFLLTLPPLKDQFYRFSEASQRRYEAGSPWPGLRTALAEGWQQRRESYDASDTMMLLLGAAGLLVSFVLKMTGR
jgi:hypothetical protein